MRSEADVALLLSFVNTRSAMPDDFRSPERLHRWLVSSGLLAEDEAVGPDDALRAVHLRAAFISLLHEAHGMPPNPRTRPTIEEVTQRAPLGIVVQGRELTLQPGGAPGDRALGAILAALLRIQLRGELDRVKACKNCGQGFWDTSKNRSRLWCDMAVCGAQAKARAYRERQRAQKAAQ